jgi:serine/threonine protein kinase
MLTINQILQQGRYRIVNQLGQNGIGMGYEAFDNELNTNVLLKEIHENLGKVTTPAQLEARKAIFAGKAKLLTEIKHESLLHVKGFFSEVDRHYLVTEFIDGNTLGELIEKKKSAFPLVDVLGWADNLLDALNYLHTLNPQIIHHEVKPQNARLSPNGKVKLLVFNIVKSADEDANESSNQTFDAAVLPYLPLEQIWGGLDAASQKVILTNYDEKSERILEQSLDARSDLYALGATLYHLLTARIPADALTRSIEILEGNADPLQSPKQINPSVPPEVSDVLMKALEIKRENRFSSAVIMRQVLRTALTRVKEREANQPKPEDDAVLEIPVAPAKPVVPKPLPVAPKAPEIESEQVRQLELIKQQLREAETRRLEAETRAAEAEKRLFEAEKHITVDPLPIEPVAESAPIAAAETLPETKAEAAAPDYQSDDFSSLFAEPQKESNVLKKVAAAAVVLIVLGGAAFGIWTFTQSKTAGSNQPVSSSNAVLPPPVTETTPSTSPVETAPVSSYQTTSDTTAATPNSPSTEASTTVSNPAITKPKAAATPTPAPTKKPAATPAKTAETQKKVTLDDLLKDN